ncbi:late secretory pathway protein avl9 [Terramyces sp. JEL0728]|nr:late secretory pathway protein avl9 [Terramyces sp. JEL0728]
MVVSFHHRNGPQVEYCNPPFPNSQKQSNSPNDAVPLPDEWSFMPFMCLPDGAHERDEEFIYFHLSPVKAWESYSKQTLFGLACFRQIDAKILFFGHKVERLSAYQYSLVSLFPGLSNLTSELLRHLQDVGSPELPNASIEAPKRHSVLLEEKHRSMDNLRTYQSDSQKIKLHKIGHPLRIFGQVIVILHKGAFFQPYIPLQQIDVLTSANTKTFLAGTSNAIFAHHKACAIDVVAHADDGNLEIVNPAVAPLISLTAADKKFIDDIIKPVTASWQPDNDMSQIQEIDFEGSDDDIRARFEQYTTQLFASMEYEMNTPPLEPNAKKIDYISEYNAAWVKSWQSSKSFEIWNAMHDKEYVGMINPGHPCHGHTIFGAVQNSLVASLTVLGKNMTPISKGLSSATAAVTSTVSDAVQSVAETPTENVPGQLLQNVSTWYNLKKMQWGQKATPATEAEEPRQSFDNEDINEELKRIQEIVAESKRSKIIDDNPVEYEHVDL